ncbi:cobalt ECF transporter T component CbiQ [Thermodesulfobacteriota bacterium]
MIEEDFSIGCSIIHRLDPRVKTAAAWVFSVVVAVSDRFPALVFSIFIALALAGLARLSLKILLSRLLLVNILIFLIWIFIPFTIEGKPLFSLGPLTATMDGVIYSAMITIKSNSIILALIALTATMPVFTLGRAMKHLYVPSKIVHLFLFTYRYIHAIHREYRRLMDAISIRGFQPGTNMHTYRTYAYLIGMLLVKSYDRAERVRAAMLCRGFRGRFYDLSEFSLKSADLITMLIMLLAVTGIGLLQWTRIIY